MFYVFKKTEQDYADEKITRSIVVWMSLSGGSV